MTVSQSSDFRAAHPFAIKWAGGTDTRCTPFSRQTQLINQRRPLLLHTHCSTAHSYSVWSTEYTRSYRTRAGNRGKANEDEPQPTYHRLDHPSSKIHWLSQLRSRHRPVLRTAQDQTCTSLSLSVSHREARPLPGLRVNLGVGCEALL